MTEVAVVVPTHNRPGLLATTLRSILAQRGVELAVAVVDDGSSDAASVRHMVEALGDPRVHLFRHDTSRGVCAARNTGVSQTNSEWVAFCDDDDVWSPEKLETQLTAARQAPADWAYAGQVAVDERLRTLDGEPPPRPADLVAALSRYNLVPAGSSNVIIRRSALDAVGPFDPGLWSVGDWDMWIRLAHRGVPACVPRPLVGCRVHGVTITRNRKKMLAEVAIVARRHGVPVDWPRHLRWAAWNSLLENQRLEAFGYYVRAAACGDLLSLARAAVALAYPQVSRRHSSRTDDAWSREADMWLQQLR